MIIVEVIQNFLFYELDVLLYIFDSNIVCPLRMLDFANSTLGYENLILFYFHHVWYQEKVNNLEKFCSRRDKIFVGILFFLVFSGIQYLRQGEISICKVLVPINVGLPLFKIFFFVSVTESSLKMIKNAFYFILKALFILKISKYLSWLFGHIEKTAWLER